MEKTSNPPRAAAAELVDGLRELDGRLRIPRGMTAELTTHVDAWLTAGHTPADVREHIAYGLPSPGRPVFRPGGLLRYLLKDVPAVRVREEPRVAAMRECTGTSHVHPRLFRPLGPETHCPDCRTMQASTAPPSPTATRGAAAARAALRGC